MNGDKAAQIYLRDGAVYVFSYADVPKYPDVLDQCIAKHPEIATHEKLGGDVLRALEAYGRPMTADELKSRPGPIRSVMGYTSDKKFNEALGSVSVDLLADKRVYSILGWRTEGLDSFPIEESKITLRAGASAAEIGEAVLKLLKHSREHNSPSRPESVKAKRPVRRASKK